MSTFKRNQRKHATKSYRVRNWREYEAGLRARGSLDGWISIADGKLVNWDAPRPSKRKPGRQRRYSKHAIETAVTLSMVVQMSSRQSEGFLRSLFALLKLDNNVPDHITISRRKARMGKLAFCQVGRKSPIHKMIDSCGLSVHVGQLRKPTKNRDYRKLHLCVDEQGGEIVACEVKSKRARDSSRVPSLVGQIDRPISSVRAAAAYDASGVYEAVEEHSVHHSPRVMIPPIKGAQVAEETAYEVKSRQCFIATRPFWGRQCKRKDWWHKELRRESDARF